MTRLLPERAAHRVGAVAAAVLALALAGCADMGAIPANPALQTAETLGLATPAAAVSAVPAAPALDSQWWLAFGDPQLDALVAQAVEGNPNLQIARARLARAQASVSIAQAADKPQVNGSLDLTRQKFSENYIYPAPLGGSVQETGTLQLGASWELDFFGKNRTALEAALGTANAAAAEADAARVMLSGNVARGYVQWARLNDRLVVAERALAQREELLRLVRDRVSAGLDTRLQLKQSESSVPEARQQIEALQEQIEIARHALDALVAKPNATQSLAPPRLEKLKAMALQQTIPADLLGRRADIAAARWRVEAATSDVANAKTQFYPNVNLVAFAGLQSIGFDNLLKSSSQMWGVGPAIRLPIFEGGKLRANLRGKSADLDAAIESYNATVFDAVREVADQLSSVQSVARQQVQQREAQAAAEAAYDIGLQRYSAGLGNYLDVLTAEVTVLAQRRDGVDLAARALESQVGLARALGGGWQPPDSIHAAATPAARQP
ncbi:efflux transporter outer membrane subunit [Variovorax sp. J22P168]|uniref:efflux transporter outer membrane subunit n=1 Tax=Variovorax jilinensis TaxID=3053513 RepID=UPI002574EDA8|nr:efflux transporter outer membrane subunit [Variovorax sp. J22P168]MDM0012952.1 efflux transporter outer membrane subunit [Variovorax sp. J22P168]